MKVLAVSGALAVLVCLNFANLGCDASALLPPCGNCPRGRCAYACDPDRAPILVVDPPPPTVDPIPEPPISVDPIPLPIQPCRCPASINGLKIRCDFICPSPTPLPKPLPSCDDVCPGESFVKCNIRCIQPLSVQPVPVAIDANASVDAAIDATAGADAAIEAWAY